MSSPTFAHGVNQILPPGPLQPAEKDRLPGHQGSGPSPSAFDFYIPPFNHTDAPTRLGALGSVRGEDSGDWRLCKNRASRELGAWAT